MVPEEPSTERLQESLHEINNVMNAMSMQAELTRFHLENKDYDLALSALEIVLAKCGEAGQLSAAARQELRDTGA